MRESALGRRSVGTVLAAGHVSATLLPFGLDTLAAVPTATIASAEVGPQQEERPLPRSFHAAAVVNGKIYVMGGAGADNKPVASVQVYDPATGTWAACADMPTPRGLFGASAVGGTIYAIGGTTRGLDKLAVVEAYDTATNTWTRRADMPTPRNALSTAVVDGQVYAIGGYAGGGLPPRSRGGAAYFSLLEVYDTATNRWARAADPPTPRSVLSSSVIDGRIYVMGGSISSGSASSVEEVLRTGRTLSVVEVYDPASGRWTRGRDLATPRGWFSTSTVNGKVYVVGGRSLAPDGGALDFAFPGIEVYTPAQ